MAKRKEFMGLCGVLLGLSAPGFDAWMLAWVALIPALWWVSRQTNRKAAFLGGAWLGAMFHGLYFIWFWDLHPLTWLGFSNWGSWLVTGAGWLLLVSEGAVLCGALMLVYYWLRKAQTSTNKLIDQDDAIKPTSQKDLEKPGLAQQLIHSSWLTVALFPLVWVLGFSLFYLTPMALPWAYLEYTQAGVPVMRTLAGWIGGSGIACLIVLHNTFWAQRLSNRPIVRPVLIMGLIPMLPLLLVMACLTCMGVYS